MYKLMESISQHKFHQDDRCPLEIGDCPLIVAKVIHLKHRRVDKAPQLREEPFEIREEWWVVKGPLGGTLQWISTTLEIF